MLKHKMHEWYPMCDVYADGATNCGWLYEFLWYFIRD